MAKKYECIKDFMPSGHDLHHELICKGTVCVSNPYCTLVRKGRVWLNAPHNSFDVTKDELKRFFIRLKEG